MFEELLPVRIRVLGANHEYTLNAGGCHAAALTKLGLFSEAKAEHQKLIAAATAAFGPLDQRTVGFHWSYANALGEAGDPAAARDLTTFVVEQLTAHRGPYNVRTLRASIDQAMWTAKAGNPQLAMHMLLRMLTRMRKTLGKNNPLVKQFEDALNSIRRPKQPLR
jgi:hypothetical protein